MPQITKVDIAATPISITLDLNDVFYASQTAANWGGERRTANLYLALSTATALALRDQLNKILEGGNKMKVEFRMKFANDPILTLDVKDTACFYPDPKVPLYWFGKEPDGSITITFREHPREIWQDHDGDLWLGAIDPTNEHLATRIYPEAEKSGEE